MTTIHFYLVCLYYITQCFNVQWSSRHTLVVIMWNLCRLFKLLNMKQVKKIKSTHACLRWGTATLSAEVFSVLVAWGAGVISWEMKEFWAIERRVISELKSQQYLVIVRLWKKSFFHQNLAWPSPFLYLPGRDPALTTVQLQGKEPHGKSPFVTCSWNQEQTRRR